MAVMGYETPIIKQNITSEKFVQFVTESFIIAPSNITGIKDKISLLHSGLSRSRSLWVFAVGVEMSGRRGEEPRRPT